MEVNMTKIMLVEDDKSLREIYGVRLLAEGYEITSAGDGEEALAMAVKEHPDLILSDVMMPKISGFDMLDIIRATPETKDIKVIMMTALSSEDQRARGESLGANRYLVKSQVGIEDVVRTVHDVLEDVPVSAIPASQTFGSPVPTVSINTQPAPVQQPQSVFQQPVQTQIPQPQQQQVQPQQPSQAFNPAQPQPVAMPRPTAPFSSSAPASLGTQTMNPTQPVRPAQTIDPGFITPQTQSQTQPQPQPAEMFKTYNPAMQQQQYAPHPSSQMPAHDVSLMPQPSTPTPMPDIASMMAQELNVAHTDPNPLSNNQINPPQL